MRQRGCSLTPQNFLVSARQRRGGVAAALHVLGRGAERRQLGGGGVRGRLRVGERRLGGRDARRRRRASAARARGVLRRRGGASASARVFCSDAREASSATCARSASRAACACALAAESAVSSAAASFAASAAADSARAASRRASASARAAPPGAPRAQPRRAGARRRPARSGARRPRRTSPAPSRTPRRAPRRRARRRDSRLRLGARRRVLLGGGELARSHRRLEPGLEKLLVPRLKRLGLGDDARVRIHRHARVQLAAGAREARLGIVRARLVERQRSRAALLISFKSPRVASRSFATRFSVAVALSSARDRRVSRACSTARRACAAARALFRPLSAPGFRRSTKAARPSPRRGTPPPPSRRARRARRRRALLRPPGDGAHACSR